ncbi:MAG: methyltransferase domain-containing protein [Chloroflexota bacterium]|nr:methyltransferase domain-containing protein [Chloroflexota bacterium]
MDKPQPDISYRIMSLILKVRDLFSPRIKVLEEVGIETGFHVLDYGCWPGSYIAGVSRSVGDSGKVYALDIHPLAISKVKALASSKSLTNVETILSACDTSLPDNSIDVVLLYDIFHHLSRPIDVLHEIHRVLKDNGILSVSDHHMKDSEISSRMVEGNLFTLLRRDRKTHTLVKNVPSTFL